MSQCDDEEPMTFAEQLVIAVAPTAVAAIIEHIVAPLVGHVVTKPQETPKKRPKANAARARAAARGFAAFVKFERRS